MQTVVRSTFLQIVRPGTSSSGSSLNKVTFQTSFLQSLKINFKDNFFGNCGNLFRKYFFPDIFCKFWFKITFVPEKNVLQTLQFVFLGQGGWSVQVGLGGPGGPGGTGGQGERGSRWSEWLGGQHG